MTAVIGKPSRTEIARYLHAMRENGVEQVMLYPRSGCELSYLSEEWFCAIGTFLSEARRLGMSVWLYDEFNWPSGDAGGRVTENPAFRLKSVTVRGEKMGTISTHSTHNASLFGEKFFPDLLSPAAVEYFISVTHEAYYARFASDFGGVICGFYTDEPSIGYCATADAIPYYDGMEADYATRFGRDFSEDMRTAHPCFLEDAYALIADRFRRTYIERLRDWCKGHGILLTGHLMEDDNPLTSTVHGGNLLQNLASFSLPGVDEIYTDLSPASLAEGSLLSLLGAAAYARGEHGAMAELFALGPCDMTYAKKRCMLYLAACFGIDHYFLAVSHLDLRGNAKITDFFSDFSDDQLDFAGMRLLAGEAQTAAQLAGKEEKADVYILYPVSLCAGRVLDRPDLSVFFSLVNALSAREIQWKFTLREEADAPVISLGADMTYRLGEKCTADPAEICAMLPGERLVTDAAGKAPQGFFVRKYRDGSACVLNVCGARGKYRIGGREVFLDRHEVFFYTPDAAVEPEAEKMPASPIFALSFDGENAVRPVFGADGKAHVRLAEKTTLRIAIRNGETVMFAGHPLSGFPCGEALSPGFRPLYTVTAPMTLGAGDYVFSGDNDLKYLPTLILLGDFSARCEEGNVPTVVLEKRKTVYRVGECVSDYGKAVFSAEVTVPAGATMLEIGGTALYTEAYLDGVPIGACIHAPYRFSFRAAPTERTCTLSLVQYSGMAPLFGDVGYFEMHGTQAQWRGTPAPEGNPFGFSTLCFVLS